MLEGTFQLGSKLGPARERTLWQSGHASWDDVLARGDDLVSLGLTARAAEILRAGILRLREARERHDVATIAAAVPAREHWRLLPWLASRAAYLDIETAAEGEIIAIGVWGPRGPAIFLPEGRSSHGDLAAFSQALEEVDLLVTYNGAAFDVPRLRASFPAWQPPPVHLDVCHLWRRLGHRGGLKELERAEGITRPAPIASLDAARAARLWRLGAQGRAEALQRFAAYNLADVAHLRALAALGYNRTAALLERDWPRLPVPERGDMLYDLSRALLGLHLPVEEAGEVVPVSTPTRLK